MAGLRRQVGAGRIVRDVSTPARPLPTEQSAAEDASAVWRILGEDGQARALRKASRAARSAGPTRARAGSVEAIPIVAKKATAASAPSRSASPSADPPANRPAGPPAGPCSGPAMRRGRIEPQLVRLLDAWATLPARVREAIVAMVDATGQNRSRTSLPPNE